VPVQTLLTVFPPSLQTATMAKKRSAAPQPEEDREGEEEEESHCLDDNVNGEDFQDNDDDDDDDDEEEDDEEEEDDVEMEYDEEHDYNDSAAVADRTDAKVASPSPVSKKDMVLRSGKRKRRRSKETTGLTPPESIGPTHPKTNKRARTESVKKKATAPKPSESNGGGSLPHESSESHSSQPTAASSGTNGAVTAAVDGSESSSTHQRNIADPRRISFSFPPVVAAAATAPSGNNDEIMCLQKDEQGKVEEEDQGDDTMAPPKLGSTNGGGNGARTGLNQSTSFVTVTETRIEVDVTATTASAFTEENQVQEYGDHAASNRHATYQYRCCLAFMLGLSLLHFMVWPVLLHVVDVVLPLDAGYLPPLPPRIPVVPTEEELMEDFDDDEDEDQPEVEIIEEEPEVIEEIVTEVVEPPPDEFRAWNEGFIDSLVELELMKDRFRSSTADLVSKYDAWVNTSQVFRMELGSRREQVEARLQQLKELEDSLTRSFHDIGAGGDTLRSADQWKQLQAFVQQTMGTTLLYTDSIELWEIPDVPEGVCDVTEVHGDDEGGDTAIFEVEEANEPLVSLELLGEKEAGLMLRAKMTAEKFMHGSVARERIRGWIKQQLDAALEENEDVVQALSRLEELASEKKFETDQSGGSQADLLARSLQDVQQTILERLEIDRADATGTYDHASLINGATVLYGGKRGTSKSLIDNLPIVNRLLQQSGFRFYGFGPEVALTSTYPRNALGQCWSFHQTTLEEQLKERELHRDDTSTPDDFKRGNFGTLTIRLAKPVWVSSVIVEHPPMRLTDLSGSAIRNFRVVGYSDAMATSKAWNLGSFQYDIQRNRRNEYLQEFEVSTAAFGKELPALQSISVAVDSNWGHDYACLYRFRVHGEEAEELK
jgi:Sad1 / UNC-like C-terminal